MQNLQHLPTKQNLGTKSDEEKEFYHGHRIISQQSTDLDTRRCNNEPKRVKIDRPLWFVNMGTTVVTTGVVATRQAPTAGARRWKRGPRR